MMTKFAAKFNEFSQLDGVKTLSDEAKVSLFGVYCQVIAQSQPQQTPSPPAKQYGSANKPASSKQIGLLKGLLRSGQLSGDTDIRNLSSLEASRLIDQGLKTKRNTHQEVEDEADEPEEGEFKGSYNHQTQGTSSSHALFG